MGRKAAVQVEAPHLFQGKDSVGLYALFNQYNVVDVVYKTIYSYEVKIANIFNPNNTSTLEINSVDLLDTFEQLRKVAPSTDILEEMIKNHLTTHQVYYSIQLGCHFIYITELASVITIPDGFYSFLNRSQ